LFSNKLTKHEKSIIAFVTLILWPLATTIHQNQLTHYGNIKGQKGTLYIQRILDNKLAIDTIKWMETL
jgi:hypothetical protein